MEPEVEEVEAVEVEPVATTSLAKIIELVVVRLVEAEQRQIDLERRFIEQAGEIRVLASALKVQQDALQEKHAQDQETFLKIADALARLALDRTTTGSGEVN